MKYYFQILTIVLILIGCGCDNRGMQSKQEEDFEKVTALADLYMTRFIHFFPEQSTFYNLENADHERLADYTPGNYNKWKVFEDSLYKVLTTEMPKPEVGTKAWYLCGILKEVLESSIELRICRPELMQVSHIQGWQINFPNVLKHQPVGNNKARQMAIKRWQVLGQYVDNEISNLKTGIDFNYTVPKDIVMKVIGQLDRLLQEPYEKSEFYSPALRDSSEQFKKEWVNLMKTSIYPAMRKYRDFLKNEYYQKARASISISALPNGNKCYEANYRYQTSIKRTTNEIKDISEYQVKLNELKIKIKGKNTYGTDSLSLILNKIRTDTTQNFSSKDEILTYIKFLIKKAEDRCTLFFNKLPSMKLEVELVPEILEDQQNSYYLPSVDNPDKSSVYYVNIGNPKKRLKGNIETNVFHETFPGHHLQMGLSVEKKTNHLITKIFGVNGYLEGWASYAQLLAQEMGLYSTEFSVLVLSRNSSCMMRLEAGIHAENWTRDQAVKYALNNITLSESIANAIIDRMIAWPGQYSTYCTGMIEILELREQAKLTLGDKFDLKEFHTVILEDGAIPLEMLREKVNWWLEKEKYE